MAKTAKVGMDSYEAITAWQQERAEQRQQVRFMAWLQSDNAKLIGEHTRLF